MNSTNSSLDLVSPAMLSRIPTILLGAYIVNSVLANYTSNHSADHTTKAADASTTTPSTPLAFPTQDRTSEEAYVRNALKYTEFGVFKPRKFHLRPAKLKRRLGKYWDPSWMSVDRPVGFSDITSKQDYHFELAQEWVESVNSSTLVQYLSDLDIGGYINTIESTDNKTHTYNYSSNSIRDGLDVRKEKNRDSAIRDVLGAVKKWMVEKASCPVRYVWEDLGVLYWPRFVRRGFCSVNNLSEQLKRRVRSKVPRSNKDCSWPPGMFCVAGEETRLKILRWKCRYKNSNRRHGDRKAFPGTSWRQAMASNRRKKIRGGSRLEDSFRLILPQEGSTRTSSRGRTGQAPHSFTAGRAYHGNQMSTDEPNLRNIMSKIQSNLDKSNERRVMTNVAEQMSEEDLNNLSWKELKRRFKVRCNWIKITYPVTNECHCTC